MYLLRIHIRRAKRYSTIAVDKIAKEGENEKIVAHNLLLASCLCLGGGRLKAGCNGVWFLKVVVICLYLYCILCLSSREPDFFVKLPFFLTQ